MLHDVTLSRDGLTLRPLSKEDAPALRSLVDGEMWAGMSTPLPRDDGSMARHLGEMMSRTAMVPFAVDLDGRLVGQTTFYDLVPGLRVEVGNTLYARDVWGTRVNPTAKLLLFAYAFDELDVGRVALRCDHRNIRSHRAITRLGAIFEGTLRSFRPAADGSVADVDYFSVLRAEWAEVRQGLERRLGLS